MAVTREQAEKATEFHTGTRTTSKGTFCNVWRRNGKTQTWKRNPERFTVPVKFGLYAFGYVTEKDSGAFIPDECPYCQEREQEKEQKG